MNDSHIYVTPTQLKGEFMKVLELFKEVYQEVGVEDYWFRLSLPDLEKSDKYGGDQKIWEDASQVIRECLEKFGVPFVEAKGEAAFYGPKLDVQVKNVTGKEDTIATSQVDILVPKRMGLKYVDENGSDQVPIIIHRAILGSCERFIGFLIEQTAGNFPFWLSPAQISVLAVGEHFNESAEQVAALLRKQGFRVGIDTSSESVGKKIRNASLQKIPAKIVIGQKEMDGQAETGQWKLKVNWRADLAAQGEEEKSFQELCDQLHELEASKK